MKKGEKKEVLDSDDEVLTKKAKTAKAKANGNNMDTKLVKEDDATKKKPRIHIKLRTTNDESKNKSKANDVKAEKKPLKRKREDEIGVADGDSAPIPKKRQKDGSQKKKKILKIDESGEAAAHRSDDIGASIDAPDFLNLQFWKQCRESLNGTFKAARKNLTQFDGWILPEDVAYKFTEIANSTLEKMDK